MIDRNRYRTFLVTSLVICGISILMFIYQTFIHEQLKSKDIETIYVANKALFAYDEIKESDFSTIEIMKDDLISGMVTDFKEFEGHYLKHSLQPGEILVQSQLTKENEHQEGDQLIPIQGSYVSDIVPGDFVGVYVLRSEIINDKQEYVVDTLFKSKRIYRNGQLGINKSHYVEGEGYMTYIRVTKEELDAYYTATKQGELIITKHLSDIAAIIDEKHNQDNTPIPDSPPAPLNPTDESVSFNPNDFINSGTANYDETINYESNEGSDNSQIESQLPQTDETISVEDFSQIKYNAKEGDTWESIAISFNTTVDLLRQLNPTIFQIEKNTSLVIPGH